MNSSSPDVPRGQPAPPVRLERVARRDHTVRWIGVLVAAFLIGAIAKPWSSPRAAPAPVGDLPAPGVAAASPLVPAPSASPLVLTVSASPPTAPAASAVAGSEDACFTSLWWATFVEGSQGHELRTWYRIEPVAATGALDAAIPTVRVFASAPWALGFCVSELDSSRRVVLVQAWRIDARARTASEVSLQRIDGASPIDRDRGGLYAAPGATSGADPEGGSADWPPGRYVFHIRFGQPEGSSDWFAIEIVRVHEVSLEVGAAEPSPSPSLTPPTREEEATAPGS